MDAPNKGTLLFEHLGGAIENWRSTPWGTGRDAHSQCGAKTGRGQPVREHRSPAKNGAGCMVPAHRERRRGVVTMRRNWSDYPSLRPFRLRSS
jgi:hypothetical protein